MKLAILTTLATPVAFAVATNIDAPKAIIPELLGADQLAFVESEGQLQEDPTCNRNGGSGTTWEDDCYARNDTFTPQCKVEQQDGMCVITANSCGCQIISENGYSSGVGGQTKGCPTACVDITNEVPLERTCRVGGEAMSFEGGCDSRNYTWTSQCFFEEETDSAGKPTRCMITPGSCGCLYWKEDSVYNDAYGLADKNCDACAVHGYPAMPSSAPGFGPALRVGVAAAIGATWFAL